MRSKPFDVQTVAGLMSAESYGTTPAAEAAVTDSVGRSGLNYDIVFRAVSVLPALIIGTVLLSHWVPASCNVRLASFFQTLGIVYWVLALFSVASLVHALLYDSPSQTILGSRGRSPTEQVKQDEVTRANTYSLILVDMALLVVVFMDCFWVYGVAQVHEASAELCGESVDFFWAVFSFTVMSQFSWPVISYLTLDPDSSDRSYIKVLDQLVFICAALLVVAAVIARMTTAGPAEGYSEYRAAQYAKLAAAAYCAPKSVNSWSCGANCDPDIYDVHICTGKTTKTIVAKWDGLCVVAFEGTSDYGAMITDSKFFKTYTGWDGCPGCRVHSGFLSEWRSLQGCIEDTLVKARCQARAQLGITGHSLGGGVSSIAMMDLAEKGWRIAEAYNFGSPRVGNKKFATTLTSKFAGRFFRVTHRMDPIPHVPLTNSLVSTWSYKHAEPEVFYNANVTAGSAICTWDGDKKCAGRYSNLPKTLRHSDDHLYYMGTWLGAKGCGPLQSALTRQPNHILPYAAI